MTPIQIAQIAAGAAFVIAAGGLFYKERRSARSESAARPTVIVVALVGAMIGYHLIVWSFPPAATALQFGRGRWYLWLVCAGVAIALSAWMDRFEKRRSGGGGGNDGET